MADATGICPKCGLRPKAAGQSYCAECRRMYLRKYYKARTGTQDRLCACCHERPRSGYKSYCRICAAEINRMWAQRRRAAIAEASPLTKRQKLAADAEAARSALRKLRLRKRYFAAGDEHNIVRVNMADALSQLDEACRSRGYDPDMMLALARVLPKIRFVEGTPGVSGTLRPVYR